MRIDVSRNPKDATIAIERLDEDIERDDDAPLERIRCPLCAWQPVPSSLWSCVSVGAPEHFDRGCGTAWNTFLTRGRCPGCAHQWRFTSCLQCHQWSPHEEWYDDV